MMTRKIMLRTLWLVAAIIVLSVSNAAAQHTLTLTGGSGVAFARFYPAEITKINWGSENFGVSWRYYSPKPRFVGCFGLDLEYLERGFSMAYAYESEWVDDGENRKEIRHYRYYTRNVNSIMLPIVWQPHFYLAKNRLRVYLDAALVLSYNLSSDYSYENNRYPAGKYEWKVPRDNRFGYGLAGGLGFAVLIKQVEIGVRARYNFGYSDILKNRNKYYSNTTDGRENPFYYSPLRSPMDNVNISFTLGWRFNKAGFEEWWAPRRHKEKRLKSFNFSEQTNQNNAQGANSAAGARSSAPQGNRSNNPGGAPKSMSGNAPQGMGGGVSKGASGGASQGVRGGGISTTLKR